MVKNLNFLKDKLRYTFLFNIINNIRQKRAYENWIKNGRPSPAPYLVKHNTIKDYAKKYSLNNFIETGTFFGATVYASKDYFSKLYSIELNEELYNYAKGKFSRYKNINLLLGDSAKILKKLIKEIDKPSLFFLDAHYCSENTSGIGTELPIFEELKCILKHKIKNHVILIDDAYCFEGKNKFAQIGYYPAVEQLREFVNKIRPDMSLKIENDMIHIKQA